MGPPPFGGGNPGAGGSHNHTSQNLQWGHRLAVVETPALLSSMISQPFLQWGHRLSVVETCGETLLAKIQGILQWGHRLSVVET